VTKGKSHAVEVTVLSTISIVMLSVMSCDVSDSLAWLVSDPEGLGRMVCLPPEARLVRHAGTVPYLANPMEYNSDS
jgi:hypothetical protein